MEQKELEIYNEAIKRKYKYHRLWKILVIVFMCLTILFATLYFGTGEVFTETINNNDVEIINEGSSGNNNNVTINN